MEKSQLVVIKLGDGGRALEWEIGKSLRIVPPHRLLFLLSLTSPCIRQVEQIGEFLAEKGLLGLSQYLDDQIKRFMVKLKLDPPMGGPRIIGTLCFTNSWLPRFTPIGREASDSAHHSFRSFAGMLGLQNAVASFKAIETFGPQWPESPLISLFKEANDPIHVMGMYQAREAALGNKDLPEPQDGLNRAVLDSIARDLLYDLKVPRGSKFERVFFVGGFLLGFVILGLASAILVAFFEIVL